MDRYPKVLYWSGNGFVFTRPDAWDEPAQPVGDKRTHPMVLRKRPARAELTPDFGARAVKRQRLDQ